MKRKSDYYDPIDRNSKNELPEHHSTFATHKECSHFPVGSMFSSVADA